MNPLALRLKVFFGVALALFAHAFATADVPNTPEGMGIYHISGALMDGLLCMVVTFALTGTRGRIMECLMLASIATNIVGFVLYLAYVSPVYYNVAMWSLTAAQCACLFFPDALGQRIQSRVVLMSPRYFAASARNARVS